MQLTSQLGEQVEQKSHPDLTAQAHPHTISKDTETCPDMNADELNTAKHATADLLSWADNVADISDNLLGIGLPADAELDNFNLNAPAVTKAMNTVAHSVSGQGMTGSQAAAKALLNAARHDHTKQSKHTSSRYMEGKLQMMSRCDLCICFCFAGIATQMLQRTVLHIMHCTSQVWCHVCCSSRLSKYMWPPACSAS